MTTDETFLQYSCEKLTQYTGRIVTCLEMLTDDQIWRRGGDNENAIGNLVLHLCGNLRQWIGFGVAAKPDIRVRDREFSARGGVERQELRERLENTVKETTAIIAGLSPQRLAEMTKVQGYDLTIFEAVYHVVEHFSYHVGQVVFATKLLTSADLGFYAHLNRPGHSEQVP